MAFADVYRYVGDPDFVDIPLENLLSKSYAKQGHVQVLLNIIDFGMDVQTALDAPRFRYILGNECAFEPSESGN